MQSSRFRLVVGLSICVIAANANAYIDPGTGSALIQGLIATVAAVGITLKLYWHRVLRLFGIGSSSGTNDIEEDLTTPDDDNKP